MATTLRLGYMLVAPKKNDLKKWLSMCYYHSIDPPSVALGMTAPEILYLTMMSVMKVSCSRSQNLCPGRSVKDASTELSVTVPG